MTPPWNPQLQNLLDSVKMHFDVRELELPDVPVFIAVAIPIDPRTTGLRPRLPAGRGLSSTQAMLSAAAESVELRTILAQNCDRQRSEFSEKDGLAHVKAQNISGGPPGSLLAQRIFLDWAAVSGEPLVYDADSNGCACGSDWPDAVNRALLECIERDAMAIWWYGRQSRSHLPLSLLDPQAPRLSWWLSKRQRRMRLIDITSDVGVPVVAAVSYDEAGHNVAMGSAAATDLGSAIVSAVTEMIQMEVSMAMGSPGKELQNWQANASVKDMPQFHPHLAVGNYSFTSVDPKKKLSEKGHQIFAVDLTRLEDLLSTARVVVPTLSVLHRAPDINRIISQSLTQPQYGGIRNANEMETLEPY